MYRKKLTYIVMCIAMMVVSCTQKELDVKLSDNLGYAPAPLLSLSAQDGEQWIQGVINNETHDVSFVFHALSELKEVTFKAEIESEWASLVSPKENEFTLNLLETQKIVVNDGIDNISYNLKPELYQLINAASVTIKGEEQQAILDKNLINFKFTTVFDPDEFKDFDLNLSINSDGELISPSTLEGLDLSDGKEEITIKDKISGIERKFIVTASTGDLVDLKDGWTDVTAKLVNERNLQINKAMKIYEIKEIFGLKDNLAYAVTVPAGAVDLMVKEKYLFPNGSDGKPDSRYTPAVTSFRDYSLFVGMQGAGVWQVDDGEEKIYYSMLCYGPDKNNETKVLRADGYDGKIKFYAPAIALKDGKVSMEYASGTKNESVLYKHTDSKGEGQAPWEGIECAFGGYFQIVKDGNMLISAEGQDAYQTYVNTYFKYNLKCFLSKSWSKLVDVAEYFTLRIGRVSVGCTENGDLVIFISDKYGNTHNQGQGKDKGHDGDPKVDTRGVTLYEMAKAMHNLGCSDVMTLEENYWSSVILQDNKDRGYDLVKTGRRFNLTDETMREEISYELPNLVIVCVK